TGWNRLRTALCPRLCHIDGRDRVLSGGPMRKIPGDGDCECPYCGGPMDAEYVHIDMGHFVQVMPYQCGCLSYQTHPYYNARVSVVDGALGFHYCRRPWEYVFYKTFWNSFWLFLTNGYLRGIGGERQQQYVDNPAGRR